MFPRIALYTGVFICVLVLAQNSIMAQCQPTVDCNQNGVADQCDIDLGTSDDCNGNQIPDECDLELATSEDCNLDGIPDECSAGVSDLIGIGLAFGNGFGSSVDSTPEFAVVGAPDDDLLGTNTGSANIFKRTGTRWIEEMKIFGVSASLEDRFGSAVAIDGDLAAIGAPGKLQGRGAVLLYRRVGNGWWNYEGTLTAFDAPLGAAFGSALAIENETIFVGAPGAINGLGSGAVYVYTRQNGMWLQDQKLESAQLSDGDMLGCSVAVHDGTVVVGAPGHEADEVTNSGCILVFEESAGIFTESTLLTAATPSPFGSFGYSVDLNHDHLLVGSPGENVDQGAAYLHNRLAGLWINQQRIEPADADESGLFGAAVGLDVKTAVISAPAAGSDQGQVIILRKSGADWLRDDPISLLSEREPGELFGSSVSCQLPFLIVGSAGENSGQSLWISVFNDCNENLEDDICDVTQGLETDCNMNLIPDTCEITDGTKLDCDSNGVLDECQIDSGELLDCNMNGIPDDCDLSSGFSIDCNSDQIPDECQVDADPLFPSISNLPNPVNVSTDQGSCGAVVVWDEPIATDNCGIASFVSSHSSGSLFSTGLTEVTYTATDVSGNVTTSSFSVMITDDELPTLVGLQSQISVDSSEGVCELSVSWEDPTPVDNCGVQQVTSSAQPGDLFPIGSTVVSYTLIDINGNTSQVTMEVIVVDTANPLITGLPANIDLLTEPGACTRIVDWPEPQATDDCTVASFSSDITSGSAIGVGTTTVTYTVVDGGGNTISESFTVTISDEELPQYLSAPVDVIAGNDPGECQAQISWAPASVDDNCSVDTLVSSHQSGDTFPLGETLVTLTLTDVNGNQSEHAFTVTILDTEAPLLSNVPTDIVIDNDPAQCTAVVNWQLPEFSDNCGISQFEGSSNSGDAFPIGTTVVEYTLVDNAGNQTNAAFSITVNDTEMPILLGLPQDISVFNDLGQCGANVTWDAPTPWDNCELADFDASHEPGAFFEKGTTEVTYTVVDGMGLVTTGSFQITVDDDESPTISGMPADRTITADSGFCSAVHTWTPPIPSDNCEVVSFTATHQPGEAFPVGVTQVSYTVVDSMGMTISDQFSITVIDEEDPVIIRIPENIVLVADEGSCVKPVSWIAPDSQDNCAIEEFSISHVSGSDFPVGDTTVEISTSDIHGNTASANFVVTILDQETPLILDMPTNISVASNSIDCGTLVSWLEPIGSDNCSVNELSATATNGGYFPVGETTVTYSVFDASGNSNEASFVIEVRDETNPVFVSVPMGIEVQTDPVQCGAIVTWNPVTADDNCAVDTISGSHSSGMFFDPGTTTVNYIATDFHGNQKQHAFEVLVLDQEAPQIIGIDENIVVSNDLGQCGANVSWTEPEAVDNCSVLSLAHSIPSGAFFSIGSTHVEYLAVDNSGNETVKSFTITVEDAELPMFLEIPDLVVGSTSEGNCEGAVTWEILTASDNCLVESITLTHESGSIFPIGDTTVSATLTDINENQVVTDFTVRIEDDELPQIVGMPTDQFMVTEVGECGAVVDWAIPDSMDNCAVSEFSSSHVPGSFFDRGTTVVSYTVSDMSGNIHTDSFEVNIVDLEVPVIHGDLQDIVAIADPGLCSTTISWIDPTAEDNCSVQTFLSNHSPGDSFTSGVTTVAYTAQDPTGNISTVQFNVTILDEENPSIVSFPSPIDVGTDLDQCGASIAWTEPQLLDNCDMGVVESNFQSGDTFPIGTTIVTYNISDASGNTISESFTVTVTDVQTPQFLNSIGSSVIETDLGECGAVHTWGVPEVLENCPGVEMTSSHNPGDFFSTGLTVVNYTATDAVGHTSSLMFTVVVQDTENPVLTGMPIDMTVETELDTCGSAVEWIAPQASDNCTVLEFSSNHNSGDVFPLGTTTVSYSTTDSSGNNATGSFEIMIVDQQAPAITNVPQSVTLNSQAGQCGSLHAWDLPLFTDNCPDHQMVASHNPGDYFEVGSTTVTFTATDSSGNITEAEFVVTVVDNESPQIMGVPSDLVLIADQGMCSTQATWEAPSSVDNCAIQDFTLSHTSGMEFQVGATTVEIATSDIHGNQTTAAFLVTVLDQELPQVVNLPADISLEADSDSCGATATWTEPTASDNCEVATMTTEKINGGVYPVGVTPVTYVVTDGSGNTHQSTFQIEVVDTTAPGLIGVPVGFEVSNDLGECGAIVNWAEVTGDDNCGILSIVTTHEPGSFFEKGTTQVDYLITDLHENQTAVSFDVIVHDNENPVINGIDSGIVVSNDLDQCGAVVTWEVPVPADNCAVDSMSSTLVPGTFFSVGSTIVTYSALDTSGNGIQKSFTVTVEDAEVPAFIDLPVLVVANTTAGVCDGIASWSEITATDNCQVETIISSHSSGDTFPLGDTTVTTTINDIHGNQFASDFTVRIEDTEAPQLLNMPTSLVTTTDLGVCGAVVDWVVPTPSDNCQINEITGSHTPGTYFDQGTTLVSYTVTDLSGNAHTESFEVSVVDLEVPVIVSGPLDIQGISDPGSCGTLISWTEPIAEDNCAIHDFKPNHYPGEFFEVGTTTVSYTAVDSTGNISTHQFNVTIEDVESPTISVIPGDITIDTDFNQCTSLVTWEEPSYADNCGILSVQSSISSGSIFNLGDTTVTYTVTDLSGLESSASFQVTVIDQQLPVFDAAPSNAVITTDAGICQSVHLWDVPTVSENCPGLEVTSSHQPGDLFDIGLTIVNYTATDAAGNASNLMFTVIVQDEELPLITGLPGNLTIPADQGACGAIVDWQSPQASDNCTINSFTSDASPGDFFPLGPSTVTYTATDSAGLITTSSFMITVEDLQSPVITGVPQSLTINTQSGQCGSLHAWDQPTASDNCPEFEYTSSHQPGDFFEIGSTMVSFTAMDTSGNITIEEFLLTVVDNESPLITDLPSNISMNTDFNQCNAVVNWPEPTFSDNCAVSSSQINIPSGSTFEVGTTTVTYSVIDTAGHETTASFEVSITDQQVPLIENTPQNAVLSTEPGTCQVVHEWIPPTVTDNCPGVIVTSSHQSGDSFPLGLNIVTYQATDAYGQSREAMFTVVVQDHENPVLSGMPEDIVLENDLDQCGAIYEWVEPITTDNCPNFGVSITHPSGTFFDLGMTTVTYTVSDSSGNTVSSSFNVTVVDLQLPQFISVPQTVAINTDPGVCGASHSWDQPQIFDNCEEINVAYSHQPGYVFPVGETLVTCTAQDLTGNVISTNFTVTVSDFEDPDFENIPQTLVVNTEPGLCDAEVNWIAPVAVDNCEVLSHSSSHQPGERFSIGETTVTLYANDIYGNEFNTSFVIVVQDLEAPVISQVPESVTIQSITGFCGGAHHWSVPTVTDNCDTLEPTSDFLSGHFFPIGTTTVEYSATDAAGNATTSAFTVTVEDVEAPVFTSISSDYTVSADADQCGAVVTWPEATASDNCGIESISYDRINGLFLELGEYPVNVVVVDLNGLESSHQFVITVADDSPPTIHDMPANIVITASEGQCGEVVSWNEPTTTDNCPGRLLASNIPSGSFFLSGTTIVSYVATDPSGNSTTETFTVTVLDDQSPTLSGIPADITVTNDLGMCGAQVSWTPATASDNCWIQDYTSSMNPGDLFGLGSTVVEMQASDASGNIATGSFVVTVTESEGPEIVNLPDTVTVSSDPGMCGAIATWPEPFAVDNCAMDSLVSNIANGSYLSVGQHEITYTATDNVANSTTASFIVEVIDVEDPVLLSVPSSVQLNTEDGACNAIVTWNQIQATDNCGIQEITSTHESGSYFDKGTTVVEQQVIDLSGNSVVHQFEVVVIDNQLPQFTSSMTDLSIESNSGVCGAISSWVEPEISDNCSISSVVKSHESGSFFDVGQTMVNYTLTDSSGNQSNLEFMVTVTDTEAPVIAGLSNVITANNDPGSCGASVFWDAPIVSDNCAVDNLASTHQPGDVFPIGNTVVTYSASDTAEIVSTFEFMVTVVDNEAPQFSNLPDLGIIGTDPGSCGAVVSWSSPTVTDNCQVTELTSNTQNGSFLEAGDHTIVFTATDVYGNHSSGEFSVSIVDSEPPLITGLPVLVEGQTDIDSCTGSVTWDEPVVSDNCPQHSVESTHLSGATFDLGTTQVTYIATDLQGNNQSVSFEVVITDGHGPEFSGVPTDVSVNTDTDSCLAVVSWAEPSIFDHCGDYSLEKSHESGAGFSVGTTQVTYTATDLAGNITQVGFSINVADLQAPLITSIPENQSLVAPVNECSVIANWAAPTAEDNCEVSSIVTSHQSGALYPAGVNNVEIAVTDSNGNVSTASFQITVIDTTLPLITGMPTDISTVSDPTICGAVITWVEPSFIENCELIQTESTHIPGTVFPVGLTVVTYVATDQSGNSSSESFNVTVSDIEAPTIQIPVPVVVEAPVGTCETYVEVSQLDVFDRCGVTEITNSFNGTSDASGVYPRGDTLIDWVVSDGSGNTSTVTGIVTVVVNGPDCNENGIPDVCDISEDTSSDCNLDGVPDDCQADCDGDGILDICEINQGLVLDCDNDGVPDDCQISSGIAADCDNDGLIDSCEIATGSGIDCDDSGVLDSCEILQGTATDCNSNGQPDVCDIAIGVESDCNSDGIVDSCQISNGSEPDCNNDGIIDSCELANGTASDCNENGSLDVCDLFNGNASDCNQNEIPDSCDLSSGIDFDCNTNGQLDVCDIEAGLLDDCDLNNVPDACDVANGGVPDCNGNGIPDSCDLSSGSSQDCDNSGVADSCEVASGATPDCNGNGVPDSCDLAAGTVDCDSNGVPDSCQIVSGESSDCNGNGTPDACDIASGTTLDCNENGVPDSCEVANGQVSDCNDNGIPDSCDVESGLEADCNSSGVPDSCEVTSGTALDCNSNGIPDSCDIASGEWPDCDSDGNIDSCEILVGSALDCNGTGIPDSCEVLSGAVNDCDGNLIPDSCDLASGVLSDCDQNGTPDSCDILAGGVEDCDGNQIPDSCDLQNGLLEDCNQNSIPDSCEVATGQTADCDFNGIPDSCDIADGTLPDENADGVPDQCQLNFLRGDGNDDGIVNIADCIFLLQGLFANGLDSTCKDAADTNDDGSVDVSDVISILGFQFNGTAPPPAPYPNCGVDPAAGTSLGCDSYNSCP